MLPIEMWEEILNNLEVLELMKIKTVSKSWHDMIDRFIKRTCKWYEKCLKDIPQEYWSSILEHQTHPELSYNNFHESKMHCHIWISMYKSWRGWNNLLKKTPRVRIIDIYPGTNHRETINSLSASANIIAVGTGDLSMDGHFFVYDISEMSKEPIFTHIESKIKDVRVLRKGNDVTVVSLIPGKMQFWDVNSKKIIYEYKVLAGTAMIGSTVGCCYVLIHYMDQIEPPEREDLTWIIEKLSCGIDLRIVLKRKRFEDETIHAMVADGENIKLLLGASYYTAMKVYEISTGNNKLKELSEIDIDLLDYGYYSMNMSKPCVLLSVESEDESSIRASIAGRDWSYCEIDCLKRDGHNLDSVTAFLYHAGLLILGSRSGEICIIRVNDVNDLEKFNLAEMEYRIVKLGTDRHHDHVDYLAVTEYNSVQYIIAVSSDKLHIIEFN